MKRSKNFKKLIKQLIKEQVIRDLGLPGDQNIKTPLKGPVKPPPPHTFGYSKPRPRPKMTPEIQNRINTINSLFLLGPCAGYNVDCADTNPLINAASNTLVAMLNAVFFVPESLYDLVTGVDYSENPEDIPGGLQYTMNIMADVLPSDCCTSPLWALCTPEGQNMLDNIVNQIHPTFQGEIEVGDMNWCPYNPPY